MKKMRMALAVTVLLAGSARPDLLASWDLYGFSNRFSNVYYSEPATDLPLVDFGDYTGQPISSAILSSARAIRMSGSTATNVAALVGLDAASVTDAMITYDYFDIIIDAAGGGNVTSLVVNLTSSITGAFSTLAVRCNRDGYTADLANVSVVDGINTLTFSEGWPTAFFLPGDSLTLRLVMYGGSSSAAWGGIGDRFLQYDSPDVAIYGAVVPEPSTALLFGIGVMGAWLLRRNHRRMR